MDAGNISEKDRMLKEKEAEVFSNLIYCFAQCKGILDCLGFCIPRKGFPEFKYRFPDSNPLWDSRFLELYSRLPYMG